MVGGVQLTISQSAPTLPLIFSKGPGAMYISELSWILDDQTKRHRREPPETGENCKGCRAVTMQYARVAALQIQ